jgi:hypothetical protein
MRATLLDCAPAVARLSVCSTSSGLVGSRSISVIDVFKSAIVTGAGDRDVDPAPIPVDDAIGANIPDLKVE